MNRKRWRRLALILLCLLIIRLPMIASAFTDDDQIGSAYLTAVEEMTRLGVLSGFEDGSFRPEETLTREQSAKIVAYLLLGKEEAEALSCHSAPFPDVAADRWSAPYIAWCLEREILVGFPDGNFCPADQLTGYQFTKMLLCAYHFGIEENYTGDRWLLAVERDGDASGLFSGDRTMATNHALLRQQAALLAYNAEQKAAEQGNETGEPSTVRIAPDDDRPEAPSEDTSSSENDKLEMPTDGLMPEDDLLAPSEESPLPPDGEESEAPTKDQPTSEIDKPEMSVEAPIQDDEGATEEPSISHPALPEESGPIELPEDVFDP